MWETVLTAALGPGQGGTRQEGPGGYCATGREGDAGSAMAGGPGEWEVRGGTCPWKMKAEEEGGSEHGFTAPGLELQEAG